MHMTGVEESTPRRDEETSRLAAALSSAWEQELRNTSGGDGALSPRGAQERLRVVQSVVNAIAAPEYADAGAPPPDDQGFALAAQLSEYSALRRSALELFRQDVPEALLRVDAGVDAAMFAEVMGFLEERERALVRLQALQRESPAREAAADFTPLFRVLVDVCDSVDSITLLLPVPGEGLRMAAQVGFPEPVELWPVSPAG